MFIKSFKSKSNNQLKGTDRRKLCEEIAIAFPSLKSEEIQNLVSKKDAVTVSKIITHNGQTGKIYCSNKIPLFFQLNSIEHIFPTIFTLWQFPDLMPTFVTRDPVIPKLAGGANLMLPGVVIEEPVNLHSFGKLKKGTPVSVITDTNKAAVAVGITALSSEDMYMSGGHGKCVEILHVITDFLYQEKPSPRPCLGPPVLGNNKNKVEGENVAVEEGSENDELETVSNNISDMKINTIENSEHDDNSSQENIESVEASSKDENSDSHLDPVQKMDNLLEYCFLKACKTSLKKGDLPMLSSTFFKNHVMNVCPPECTIDVKKSSHKKLSVFLANMKEKGLIDTSIIKGVESLLSVKYDHPLLKGFVITEDYKPSVKKEETSAAPAISECYKVTSNVLPILSKYKYEKGDVMKRAEIRECFTEYVKSENLQNGKILKINPILADILRTKENQESITMEDGINKFIGKMTHSHEITVAGTKLIRTGKLEPIDITVATRANNKKVTLINNLETYGLKLDEFSKECQGIGASATITDIPGKKTPSVLVQGNQVLYIYKLLTEKYRINKNHIKGLEFAPKKKK